MKTYKIEINSAELATILLSLIANRHRFEKSLKTGKDGNYKLTKESRKNIEADIKNIRKLENFFDGINKG